MSGLLSCGICCMLTSIWGVVQLFFMGIFFYIEAVVLLEDVEAEEYEDYDDFIKKTKSNYKAVRIPLHCCFISFYCGYEVTWLTFRVPTSELQAAINCWVAAAIYLLTLGLSYTCIVKARSKAKKEALLQEDDEYACTPKEPPKKKADKVK